MVESVELFVGFEEFWCDVNVGTYKIQVMAFIPAWL